IDIVYGPVSRDAPLKGGKGHHHDIVLILAKAGVAFWSKQADDLARRSVDADRLAFRIAGAEELFPDSLADQAHGRARTDLGIGKAATGSQRPVACVK